MNRQFRRRIEREWNKIKVGKSCTKFMERNGLLSISHVLFFQAVKAGEDLVCVYSVGLFEFREGSGFLEHATICHFVSSLFRILSCIKLGFVSEEELENGEDPE